MLNRKGARTASFDAPAVDIVLCDLDGVVWLAHAPIDGAVEAIAALRAGGRRVLFVTNNSAARLADHVASLEAIGVPAEGDVISSAGAAATLIAAGERVLVAGGPGVVEAIEQRGATAVVNDGSFGAGDSVSTSFDAVVVGLHRDFDYRRLAAAAAAVRGGARLIGTNTDPTYPTPTGLEPGGGSILAAIATASGVQPVVGGKPHPPMVDLVRATIRLPGREGDDSMHHVLMVGDRPDTDGLLAARLGCPFALVHTGVGVDDAESDGIRRALDVADLAAVAVALHR